MVGAARWEVLKVGHFTSDAVRKNAAPDLGHRSKEGGRVRMRSGGANPAGNSRLNDLARIEDFDVMSDSEDVGKVVSDQEQSDVSFLIDRLEEIEELPPGDRIKGRCRLVGHDQARIQDQYGRHQDSLAHPRGELVRIGRQNLLGVFKPHFFENLGRQLLERSGVAAQMAPYSIPEKGANRLKGAQRRDGLLGDVADIPAPDSAKLLGTQGRQVAAGELHLS